jgi:hypothetical protein
LVDRGTVRRADGLGMRKLQGTDSVQAIDSTSSTKSADSTTAAQKADKADYGFNGYAQAAAMAMGGGLGPQVRVAVRTTCKILGITLSYMLMWPNPQQLRVATPVDGLGEIVCSAWRFPFQCCWCLVHSSSCC